MDINEMLQSIAQAEDFPALKASACLPEPDGDCGYLFVSYSHADYKAVIPDIVRLQARGLGIWYDRGLESGKSWIGEVRKKISSYDCRGVLFYISESFLASPSCMQELFHYLGSPERSCLFILIDGEREALSERLRDATLRHAPEEERKALLAAAATAIRKNACLPIGATADKKAKKAKRFSPPALLTYGKVGNRGNPINALYFLGTVSVTGVLDKNVRTVRIPNFVRVNGRLRAVRGIGAAAFFGCEMLEEVVMPRFRYVEHAAFVRCPSLRRVRLLHAMHMPGLPTVGVVGDIFDGCPQATLTVGSGYTIFTSSFRGRTDLTEVRLPRRQLFAQDAFAGCTALTHVAVKRRDQCTYRTFAGCCALSELHMPRRNITRILQATFEGCTSLRAVSLPHRLRFIGQDSFSGCTSLTEITLPPHLKGIDDGAFTGCTSLSRVSLLGRVEHFLENTPYHRRQALDRLFPSAERFYFKKKPTVFPFDGEFYEAASDRRGFILYIKGEK